MTSLRLERQRRVTEQNPLRLDVVVEECVLRRPIGGWEVLRSQLSHMLEMSKLPHVSVQVLPTSVGAHSGMDGKFVLLEFEDFGPGVFLEGHPVLGARYDVEDPVLIDTYASIANALREEALNKRESAKFIEEVLAELP